MFQQEKSRYSKKILENQFIKPGITLFISYLLGKFHKLRNGSGKAVVRAADRRITTSMTGLKKILTETANSVFLRSILPCFLVGGAGKLIKPQPS
jgi:hypothetical protein